MLRFAVFFIFLSWRAVVVSKLPSSNPHATLRYRSSEILSSSSLLPEDKRLVRGSLANGLEYILLPSKKLHNCAAYLEFLSGSADEEDHQCGMAHFVEHLVYTPTIGQADDNQIQTNAFTDFHHTVFYATNCPDTSLPRVCDSFVKIFDNPLQQYSVRDIEAEKSDVLAEMSQIDIATSRTDSQIFCCLHSENVLSKRLPIGQREQILSWKHQDLLDYFHRHYIPQNAKLYICGNFNDKIVKKFVSEKFSRISSNVNPQAAEQSTMKKINRHFPPVIHRWASNRISKTQNKMMNESSNVTDNHTALDPHPNVALLPCSSSTDVVFHFFAKIPLLPVVTFQDLRRQIIRKLIQRIFRNRLHYLQNGLSNTDPLFSGEFYIHDSVKEGCTVIDLSFKCHVNHWETSLRKFIQEAKRLEQYGIRDAELLHSKQALLEISLFEEEDVSSHLERFNNVLMENVAKQHALVPPQMMKRYLKQLLLGSTINLDEINSHISDIFSFLSVPARSRIVVLTPSSIKKALSPDLILKLFSSEDIADVNRTRVSIPITIYYPQSPDFLPIELYTETLDWKDRQIPIERGIWSNTLRINLASTASVRDNIAVLRASVPLLANGVDIDLFVKMITEGGAMGKYSSNIIDNWCADNNIGITVARRGRDTLQIDLETPVTEFRTASQKLYSLLQLISLLMQEFQIEEFVFARAQAILADNFDCDVDSYLKRQIFQYYFPDQSSPLDLSFEEVKTRVSCLLHNAPLNITIVAPIPLEKIRNITAPFFHDLSRRSMVPLERQHKMHSPPKNLILLPLNSSQTKENKTYGYLAGRIPLIPSSLPSLADALLLQLSQDLINQRLFEIVRGKHHLVYDTSISFHPHEGIFLISSQSSSYEKSLATVAACKEALHSTQDLSPQDLERHLYRLQERLLEQSQRSEFWVDMLHDHTIPLSSWNSVNATLHTITSQVGQSYLSFPQSVSKSPDLFKKWKEKII